MEKKKEYYFLNVKNTRASSFHHSGAILRLRKCGILCTHSHVLKKRRSSIELSNNISDQSKA